MVCDSTAVLQVVHTEPYYSRKDDVPERPREFAGNVFRISHKDQLQVGGPGSCLSPPGGMDECRDRTDPPEKGNCWAVWAYRDGQSNPALG